jgi:microcystin-dependent protein
MAISLKHLFTSSKADGTDSTLVQPSNWNAEHQLQMATARIIGRTTAGAGAAEEISVGAGLTLTGLTLNLASTVSITALTASGALTGGSLSVSGDGTFTGTGGLKVPAGTTAQRPTAATGLLRFNSTLGQFEGYNGTAWAAIGGAIALDSTAGLVVQTGADTFTKRTLTAGTGITITNGDGVAGDPVISGGVPSGAVAHFAMNTAPTGWLKANGAAVSRTTYASLFAALVTSAGFTSQTFTVSIAATAVFTKTAHGFTGGERLRLSTTGALPTGLNSTADYFVIFFDANTFGVSTTFGGTPVNTSGTQSGTHSYIQSLWGLGNGSTTFNLPDLRGEFMRGWDDGRGVDTGRAFGSAQADQFKAHTHTPLNGNSFMTNTTLGAEGLFNFGSGAAVYTGIVSTTSSVGGTETRPRNIALLACIKF